MEMKGEQLVPASLQETWGALNDPDVLKACVPGCEAIDLVADNEYRVQMVARVGPVSAKFKGRLTLSDIKPPSSYSLAFEGQGGAAGFAKGSAQVRLAAEDAGTRLSYDVKAAVGGKLAQIGSRLVDAAAKKIADDFFRNFSQRLTSSEDDTVVLAKHAAPAHAEGPGPAPAPPAAEATRPGLSDAALAAFAGAALLLFVVALWIFLS